MKLTFEKGNSKPTYWFNIHTAINELKAHVDSVGIRQAPPYTELNQT